MKGWFPEREHLVRSRWLRPLARYLEDDRLWHMERGSVARGVAIGLFFGLLVPVAQFLLAVAVAIWLRGHVAIAAGATLVSNPFTFAPLYWFAHRIGSGLLGHSSAAAKAQATQAGAQTQATAAADGWWAATWEAVQAAGAPLLLGLAVMAVLGALVGYALVWLLWRSGGDAAAKRDRR